MGTYKNTIDPEQRLLIENAQRRIRQKKGLARHFAIFLAGSILLIVINVVLGYGEDVKILNLDWFVWAIIFWAFILLVHTINVLFIGKLMGASWEENQMQKLVAKQEKRIAELQAKVEKKYPLPQETNNNTI